LENIKLVFLPANTTSMLQPMDQGVIRSLKCHRKLILLRMMECIEKKQDHAVTLLDAIRCIKKAWRQVTDRTIHNCFRHAGILSAQGVNVTENEDDVEVEVATAAAAAADDDDLPLSEWVRKIDCDVLGHYDYDKYAHFITRKQMSMWSSRPPPEHIYQQKAQQTTEEGKQARVGTYSKDKVLRIAEHCKPYSPKTKTKREVISAAVSQTTRHQLRVNIPD
jgi:hypothetical protein